MAKMNEDALTVVKQKFQDGEFIIVEGIIYKKIITDRIAIQGSRIPVSKLKYLITSKDTKWFKEKENEISDSFKEAIVKGEFIIKDNTLYKKYGGTHERGYKEFTITIDGTKYPTYAHRIIYYIYTGIWDDSKVINHIDCNKANNNIENLELITQFENIIHSLRNDEIVIDASYIDNRTKEKYRLNDEQWEVFRVEAYAGFKRSILKNYEPNSDTYKYWSEFETLDAYEKYWNEYIKKLKGEK